MSWDTSDRRDRLPHDWAVRRLRVLRRDSYRCQARLSDGRLCLAPASDVDHIVRGDDHRPENLQSLCRWHHSQKTAAEAAEARRANPRPSRQRPPEKHPGAL